MSLFFQSESTECGLACIAIALEKLGAPIELHELRRKFPVSSRGLTVKDLVDIAAACNVLGRAVRCELDELSDLKCPAILHWGLNHFVILNKISSGKATIIDPASGKSTMPLRQVSNFFTGIAVELSPTPSFKKKKIESPLSLWSWFRWSTSVKTSLIQILLLSLLLQVFVVASPFYMQLAIDQAALKGDGQLLNSLAIGFGLFTIFNIGANVLRSIISIRLTSVLSWDMSLRLFRHLIRLPLPWFQKRKLADILSRFEALTPVRSLISGSLIATIIDGVLGIITAIMMMIFAPSLAYIVIFGVCLYIAIRLVALPKSIQLGMEALTAHITENGKRIETIRAIQTIKVMGAETERENDWASKFSNTVKRDLAHSEFDVKIASVNQLIEGSINLALIFFGAKAIMANNMTVGILYAFLAYSNQFSLRARALFDQYINWRLTDMYSYRLADIVLTPKEQNIDVVEIKDCNIEGQVSLNAVAFRYSPRDRYVFKDISIDIRPREFIAITGPSGSGKSTLLKVVCGLYPATLGDIRIDGATLATLPPKRIRGAIGVVLQDDELLTGSIVDNVTFFAEDVDVERVWSCLYQAQLAEEISSMPMGIDTYLGDMGSNLSGGQKQRLLLARALYRGPKILVLDEATSHLDAKNETEINLSLAKLDVTRIIVAHRKETILAADRVICIDNGRIVFDKKREELTDSDLSFSSGNSQ